MRRRVVQVSQIIGPADAQWQGALLDGTVWERWNDGTWCQVPPVPQPTEQEVPYRGIA